MKATKKAKKSAFNKSSRVKFVSTRDWDRKKFDIEYLHRNDTLYIVLDPKKIDWKNPYADFERDEVFFRYNEIVPQSLVEEYLEKYSKVDRELASRFIIKEDCILISEAGFIEYGIDFLVEAGIIKRIHR